MTDSKAEEVVTRPHTSYESFNDRFMTCPPSLTITTNSSHGVSPYNRQYSNVYNARLNNLKPKCLYTFQNKQKDHKDDDEEEGANSNAAPIVPRIIELQEDMTSFIVGTIIKQCPKKPKINFDMNQLYHQGGLSYLGTPYDNDDTASNDDDPVVDVEPALSNTTYCDITNDTIVLEDQSGRVELHFLHHNQSLKLDLVTGIVLGVEGKINPGSNLFEVHQIYHPTMGPRRDIPSSSSSSNDCNDDGHDDEGACVLLMSGLDCGGHDSKRNSSTSLKRELVIDYITGHISSNNGESISRIIIAGGGCAKPIRPENASNNWSTSKSKSADELQQKMKETTLPIRELDLFLSEICAYGIPVDYIPGLYDPTNANWPQKPLHECLVPNANTCTNMLNRSTNPYEARIGDRVFMGSDGLNISDLRLYLGQVDDSQEEENTEKEIITVSKVQALHSSLKFNHMVPTGPDSVPTFPFDENDPFVIQNVPNVYFCGNCEKFETKAVDVTVSNVGNGNSSSSEETVRLICIPSFVKTGQVVWMNLKSMECKIIEFDDVILESTNGGDDDDDDNDDIAGNVIDEKKTE